MKKLFIFFLPFALLAQNDIEVDYVTNSDNSLNFKYVKNIPGTHLVSVKFSNLSNTLAKDNQSKLLKSSRGSLFKLEPINELQQIRFRYSYSWFRGNINSKVNFEYPYILPFKANTSVKPVELYNIDNVYFKSELAKGWKAYSFSFNENQTVYSIRKGEVIEIIDNFEVDNSKTFDYYSNINSITIEHKDGTYATYKGFDKDKIKVKIGEIVFPQTILGELSKFDNRNLYRLYLQLYFYRTIDGISLNTIESSDDYEIRYLTPKFFQNKKLIELKNNESYVVQFDEKILFNEMRRKEIKKWKSYN